MWSWKYEILQNGLPDHHKSFYSHRGDNKPEDIEHRKDLSSFVFFFHNFLLFSFPEWKGVSDFFGLFLERLVQEVEHALQRIDSAYSRVTLASCSLQWIHSEKSML